MAFQIDYVRHVQGDPAQDTPAFISAQTKDLAAVLAAELKTASFVDEGNNTVFYDSVLVKKI